MSWGKLDDIKNILDNGNKDYELSYLNSEVLIRIDNIDINSDDNKYSRGKIIKDSNGINCVKFIGIVRYTQLIDKINRFISMYNTYSDTIKISLNDFTGYRLTNIIRFKSQSEYLKVCDVIRRIISLDLQYTTKVQESYMEVIIFNEECKISFFKEPDDMSRAVFLFIESINIQDHEHKLNTVANIVGVLMKNQNLFTDPEDITLLPI